MKYGLILCVFALMCVTSSMATDFISGAVYNSRLTWQEKCEYVAYPFMRREKEVFYSDVGQQIIKGIVVRETTQTKAEVSVTTGGVGFTYVNLHFRSERGCGLHFTVEIYV